MGGDCCNSVVLRLFICGNLIMAARISVCSCFSLPRWNTQQVRQGSDPTWTRASCHTKRCCHLSETQRLPAVLPKPGDIQAGLADLFSVSSSPHAAPSSLALTDRLCTPARHQASGGEGLVCAQLAEPAANGTFGDGTRRELFGSYFQFTET